jgi:uncharacterized membrane-anchored protein
MGSLALWYGRMGSISVNSVSSPSAEIFYWVTIMFSQTLGTALGDWAADSAGLGYAGGTVLFGSLLIATAGLYFWTHASRTALFWAAFILTRPLGAVVGDFLDKPLGDGGLNVSRYAATAGLLLFMAACILLFPHRAAREVH